MHLKQSEILEQRLKIKMDEAMQNFFDGNTEMIAFPEGSIVVMQGDYTANMYFMVQGIVRGYYIDEEGSDITKCFAAENEFFCSEGFMTNKPSSFFIECLENCKCIRIPYTVLHKMTEQSAAIQKAFDEYTFTAFKKLQDHLRDFVMEDAKERYLKFHEDYPELEQRINQNYIASYIGIHAGSLSRIRKQIKEEISNSN